MAKNNQRLYLIPVLSKSLDVLELLQNEKESLALEAIQRLTRIPKTTVYRILKTYIHRGYVAHTSDGTYKLITRPKKLRFGFAGQSGDLAFSVEVTQSLVAAAAANGVELVVLDNRYDAATAVRNAQKLIKSGVDLILELQVKQSVAPVIGDKIAAAKIPLIAIDIPHPNAVYFGVDNYRVGVNAGEMLAEYVRNSWSGKANWVLGLDLPEAGPLAQSRISGAFDVIQETFPELPVESFVRMDGRGLRDQSKKLVADFLRRHPKDKNILIVAATDTSALGAVDAARELKREQHVAVVGQDCIAEAVEEMSRRTSPFVGTVSHETGSYGPALIHLGLCMLRGNTVPPYNYVKHRIVTRASLLTGKAEASKPETAPAKKKAAAKKTF